MYDISFKGETAASHNVLIAHRPAVPAPEWEVQEYVVGGRDGVLTEYKRILPIEISVEMGFREDPALWAGRMRDIKKWLTGNGKLILGDDNEWFYKVNRISIGTVERMIKRYGFFTAVFLCDPYMYRLDGLDSYAKTDDRILNNAWDVCHPVYTLPGSGQRTVTVNGKTFTVNGSGTIVIDTDRMVTYINASGTFINAATSGNYEDLYLKPGANTVASSVAATITPKWRAL